MSTTTPRKWLTNASFAGKAGEMKATVVDGEILGAPPGSIKYWRLPATPEGAPRPMASISSVRAGAADSAASGSARAAGHGTAIAIARRFGLQSISAAASPASGTAG